MASSSTSAAHFSEETNDLSCQTGPEMESSKIRHWSKLDYSRTSSEWSVIANFKDYDMLKEHREWGRFFRDFPTLELGKKISEGAQAEVYEARMTRDGPFTLVAKVMMGDAPLPAFQAQWPIGMLSAFNSSYVFDLPLMTILGGTVLADGPFRGRFAFVMYRRWGDLRLLIDRRMKLKRTTVGPFFIKQVIQLMMRIAEDMDGLHTKHDIIHRDLKASNVLVWGEFGDNVNVVAPSEDEKIESVVADFECSVGVLGTGWWRAPEILRQMRARDPGIKVQFTRASDVYSYGMTCYEIVTGCLPFEDQSASEELVSGSLPFKISSASEASHEIVSSSLPLEGLTSSEESDEIVLGRLPFEGCSALDAINKILDGWRPDLPVELPSHLRSIIMSCWQSDCEKRPNFSDICKMLKIKQGCNPTNVVIDNESDEIATIIKVEQTYDILQPMPLHEAFERLLQLQLCASKSKILHMRTATGMVVQQFKVTDDEGRKVCDENRIANIVKVLSLPTKVEWVIGRSDDIDTDDTDTVADTNLIQILAGTGGPSLIARILAFLTEMKLQIYEAGCWTHDGQVGCAMDVENGKEGSLLLEILAKEAKSEASVHYTIVRRDANVKYAVGETNLVQITYEHGGHSLLGSLIWRLIHMGLQVYKVRCRSHDDGGECAIYVDGAMDFWVRQSLMAEVEVLIDAFGGPKAKAYLDLKIVFRRLASRDLNLDLPGVKYLNLMLA